VSNKPAQPHQKRSIVGGESVKYFEFGIAATQSTEYTPIARSVYNSKGLPGEVSEWLMVADSKSVLGLHLTEVRILSSPYI
jgi:hypothetical protein